MSDLLRGKMGWPDPYDFVLERDYATPSVPKRIINKIKKKPYRIIEIVFFIVIVIPIVIVLFQHFILGWENWADWTGFNKKILLSSNQNNEKTLWDWMELFFMPLVLTLLTVWFNLRSSYLEQDRILDQQREEILQSSIEEISDIFLRNAGSVFSLETGILLRTKILTTLRLLDGIRKGIFIQFLYETYFLRGNKVKINLFGADLSDIDLFGAQLLEINLQGCLMINSCFRFSFLRFSNLSKSNLSNSDFYRAYLKTSNFEGVKMKSANFAFANLEYANFRSAELKNSNFKKATMYSTNLSFSNLDGVDFSGADLYGANLENARWETICFRDTIMPDGEKFNPKLHTKNYLTKNNGE